MKIGRIPYLNSVLFYDGLPEAAVRDGVELEFEALVPRGLSGAVVEDHIAAGPVPLVTTWDVADRYDPLVTPDGRGDFCIATVTKAHSILLFSKRPFDCLDGATVGVTTETSTSVRLMKVLFAEYWKVQPRRYTGVNPENNDAFLLIGDEALVHRLGITGFVHVADLGEVWSNWTSLPFVFARWVVRRDVPANRREQLVRWIDESIEKAWPRVESVVAERGARLRMTPTQMRAYLEAFHFRMTPAEYEAIARFQRLDSAVRSTYGQTAA